MPTCPGWAGPHRPRWNWDLRCGCPRTLWDRDAEDTLAHLVSAAGVAEELRQEHPGRVFLSVGSELSMFMCGIIAGDTVPERIALPDLGTFLLAAATQQSLNGYLAARTPRSCRPSSSL